MAIDHADALDAFNGLEFGDELIHLKLPLVGDGEEGELDLAGFRHRDLKIVDVAVEELADFQTVGDVVSYLEKQSN